MKYVLIINFLSHGNQVKSWIGNWQWYIYTHCQIARLISDFRQCRELPKKSHKTNNNEIPRSNFKS